MANEKRLVDANGSYSLNDCNRNGNTLCFGGGIIDVYDCAGKCLCQFKAEDAPSVDAVEVVHGRWIPLEYDGYADGNPVWDLWECSECGDEHSGDEDTLTPYCPNCGAKMDGGKDDERRTERAC